MSDGQIHFEVFARRNQNASLVLEMATEDRARAMAYAEELLQSGSVAVRVSKEVLDPESGEYSSVTILTKGVAAPKNMPSEIVEKLNNEINTALADPKMTARLADVGGTVLRGSYVDFAKLVAEDIEKWAKVIRAANIKPE